MLSFDDFPIVYFILGYALAAVIVLLVIYWNKLRFQELAFLLLSGILVAFMRLPIVVFNQEINPDESQMIAHAITLRQFPIYWQSVDGTTIGPLDNYILIFPSFLGFSLDYTSARLVGLICVLGSLCFFYKSLKNFFNDSVARLALLPPLFLIAFTQDADLVHYSSEQLPVFLLNVGLWLLSRLFVNDKSKPIIYTPFGTTVGLFWLGLVVGMSPFAKIQVVPQAVVLCLFALVFTFRTQYVLKNAVVLVAGGLVFPLLTIGWAVAYGVLDDFLDFYVLGNLIYAGGSTVLGSVLRLPSFFAKSPDFLLFLVSIGLTSFLTLFTLTKQRKGQTNLILFICLGVFAALYAATKSGNDFVHYLNLCIYPFGLLGALFIDKLPKNGPLVPTAAFVTLAPFLAGFGFKAIQHLPLNAYISGHDHRVPISAVSQLILKHAQPTDRLVIWGWMCRYHVETQMPQGTAENHSERCIYPHPLRQKYYERYLNDLKKNHPKVFVDAVGNSLWLNDRTTQAHEAFPELKRFIEKNYRLLGEVEDTRVYVKLKPLTHEKNTR